MKRADQCPAEMRGPFGAAWRHDLSGVLESERARAPIELTIASWILHAPQAHPLWSYYWLGCVSLREMVGAPPAWIYLPGATHEVMLYALNPYTVPCVDSPPLRMEPANFHGQFIEPNDAAAAERIVLTVRDVVDGRLSPDTDYLRCWAKRFSDSNVKRVLRSSPGDDGSKPQ